MKEKIDIPLVLLFFSITMTAFVYGLAVGKYEVFPYQQILYLKKSTLQAVDEFGMWTKTRPSKHLFDSRYTGEEVTKIDKEQMFPGPTLISSMFDDNLALRLLDANGTIINQWPTLIFNVWDNFDHMLPPENQPKTNWNTVFGGALLFPDGSIVFNLAGLVKMDRCGEILWTLPKDTHHSLEPSGDGGFWTGSRRYISEKSKHPPFVAPYFEDTLLKVSSNGTKMIEISVIDLLIKNNLQALVFSNNRFFQINYDKDITHLNDIEELTVDDAPAFPQFAAGDLLVSIREPNMVFVVDPSTERIKWYRVGPWNQQHDADFQSNGTITVFDNHYDGTEDGALFGGSRIIRVYPETGHSEIVYGGRKDQPMYTRTQGSHQFLDNGNLLIIESKSGRVLEVDPDGRTVWEYINRYSKDKVIRISGATRYPNDYLVQDTWECNKESLD